MDLTTIFSITNGDDSKMINDENVRRQLNGLWYRLRMLRIIDEGESGEVIHDVDNNDSKDDKYDNNRNKDNKGILICRKRCTMKRDEEWWTMSERRIIIDK